MNQGSSADRFTAQFMEVSEQIAVGLVGARVRIRALLELLEEKGTLGPGDFDVRAQALWDRDYEELATELTTPSPEEEAEEEPPDVERKPMDPAKFAESLLQNFVAESVGGRIRIRALLELLEEKGILGPGEFDRRAEEIWDRDYEELAMEYYRKQL